MMQSSAHKGMAFSDYDVRREFYFSQQRMYEEDRRFK
jgi:hypothetical protein